MKLHPCLRILIALCSASLGFASDGCQLEEFQKVPSGFDGALRYWVQVKLKTPLRKETTLFVQPDDIHGGIYDVFVTGGKLIYPGISETDLKTTLQSICPDLFANSPLPGVAHAMAQPQAAGVRRRAGQMSANTAPADVNGDGILDAVELSDNIAIVTLLKADGSTLSSAGFTTVKNAFTVIVADFNGDGKPDLAVGGDSNGTDGSWLGILMGNGDGTFQPVKLLAAGNGIEHLAAVDLNGDGKLDLVAANPYSNKISVLLGNGDGTFRTPVAYAAPTYPSALVVTDLNNDGRPDVAVLARFGDQLGVFLSNGDGTLKPALTQAAGRAGQALAFADVNNDGQVDLVGVDYYGNALSVMFGRGDGTFRLGGRYLTATQSQSVSVIPLLDGTSLILTSDGNTGNMVLEIAAADGTLSTPDALDGGTQLTAVAAGDVNGDGKPDVVWTDGGGSTVSVALNTGGSFAVPKAISLASSTAPSAVAIADLNGDKRGDLILAVAAASSGVGGIGVMLSGTDGTPGAMQLYPVGVRPAALVTGDFNGDGKIDVAVACSGTFAGTGDPGNVGVLLGKGDGTFLASVSLPLLAGQSPVSITAADFDGDGRLDLAVATKPVSLIGPGKITIYAGKGDGTFAAGRDVPFSDPTNYPEFVTSADLNGDGKMDLVALLYVQNPVWVVASFLNRGGGNFTATATTATEFGPITAVAKDFDGDGKVDLVVAHCCGLTDTTTLLGNGDGTFQADEDHLSVPSPVALATADFDGDGKPDLIMGGNRDRTLGGVVATMVGAFPAPSKLLVVSAADGKVTNIAADSIASAFGNGLAATTSVASSAAWPTTLGGTSVQIRDSAGVNKSGLLSYASPTQVNFAVPPGLANGAATVTIQPQGGAAVSTTVSIAPVAPGLFNLNAAGLAAALVFRVKADGSQSVEQVYQVNASGQVVAKPIDLGPATDQVYLLLFGTGIRQGSGAKVTIGGVDAPVSYAGPQGQYSGFDQVNARLPRILAGKGSVAVQLVVSGVSSGTSLVTIQ